MENTQNIQDAIILADDQSSVFKWTESMVLKRLSDPRRITEGTVALDILWVLLSHLSLRGQASHSHVFDMLRKGSGFSNKVRLQALRYFCAISKEDRKALNWMQRNNVLDEIIVVLVTHTDFVPAAWYGVASYCCDIFNQYLAMDPVFYKRFFKNRLTQELLIELTHSPETISFIKNLFDHSDFWCGVSLPCLGKKCLMCKALGDETLDDLI
jgi:hypothetical protein